MYLILKYKTPLYELSLTKDYRWRYNRQSLFVTFAVSNLRPPVSGSDSCQELFNIVQSGHTIDTISWKPFLTIYFSANFCLVGSKEYFYVMTPT